MRIWQELPCRRSLEEPGVGARQRRMHAAVSSQSKHLNADSVRPVHPSVMYPCRRLSTIAAVLAVSTWCSTLRDTPLRQ